MLVRGFTKGDKEIFIKLCEMFYTAGVTLKGFDRGRTIKTFGRVLDRHENLWGYLICDKDEEVPVPIGYALITSYWSNEEGGEVIVLDELFINPISRSKGYGKLFMAWLEDHFSYASSLSLEVLEANTRARELYERMGFKADGYISYDKKLKKGLQNDAKL